MQELQQLCFQLQIRNCRDATFGLQRVRLEWQPTLTQGAAAAVAAVEASSAGAAGAVHVSADSWERRMIGLFLLHGVVGRELSMELWRPSSNPEFRYPDGEYYALQWQGSLRRMRPPPARERALPQESERCCLWLQLQLQQLYSDGHRCREHAHHRAARVQVWVYSRCTRCRTTCMPAVTRPHTVKLLAQSSCAPSEMKKSPPTLPAALMAATSPRRMAGEGSTGRAQSRMPRS